MTSPPHPTFRSLTWLLIVCALCAVTITPLLRADSPCTHDGGLHYFRVVAMRQALQDGVLFSRWVPDLAFGYGLPFFNYREIIPYYLALAFHLLGLALPAALNLVYILSIVGSAITAYLLGRDLFGPQAGIITAVAYAYAPYQLTDALVRGNVPESVALMLLPLILWAFRRLILTGHRRWFAASVASLAILLLDHNISSLLFVPFLVAYLFVLWLVHRRECHWRLAVCALVLALGLTAFFWGPAILEKHYVQLHMSRSNRNNDFHYNFVPLAELLSPPAPADTSLMNPPLRIQMGLAPLVLGGIGLVVGLLRRRDREQHATLVFSALAAGAMVWMSTDASLWLWERVPLLPFVQFPWRFIGRAALPVAILAGALASPVTPRASRFTHYALRTLPLISVTFLILAALPTTYPAQGYCPQAPHPTINDLFAYEHRSKLVGTDPTGSYFPAWIRRKPGGSLLEDQYATGETVARFDETALPEGASITEAEYGPNRARIVVETPADFHARYLAFYFPGWRVWIDGESTEIAATAPDGLIAFAVPAGRHTVIVRFGETPLRLTADTISLLSLLVLLILMLRYPSSSTYNHQPAIVHGSLIYCSLLVFLGIALLIVKLALVDRTHTLFRHPVLRSDGALPGVEHPINQPYADGMALIGYNRDQATIPADGALRLDLYWTVYAQPTARYQTVIHLVGPDGVRWSQPDSFRPRGYAKYPPTTTWNPGRYALDSHEVEPLPGAPPGAYDVVLTTFDRDTLAPLSVLNEHGQPAAPDLLLGQVTLTVPRRSADPDQLGIRNRLDARLGTLTLLGAGFDRDQAAPGDAIFLTTFWQADERPAEDYTLHLSLLAGDGSSAAEYDLSPAAPWYPTSAWQPGDVWRGQHRLRLPANLDDGDYSWRATLLPTYQSTDLPSIIHITAPPHTFTAPPVDLESGTRLGDIATLIGADLEPITPSLQPGTLITVTLVWKAESTTDESHHVFLHLLDPEGRLVAQSDGVPAGWSRPTTGWVPGEVITDAHTLTIPPNAPGGDYTLQAGLYDPIAGTRLADPAGADAISLAIISVEGQ